jgi:hypothetical protein
LAAIATAAPITKERARAIATGVLVPKRGRALTRSATATALRAWNALKYLVRLEEDFSGVEVAV